MKRRERRHLMLDRDTYSDAMMQSGSETEAETLTARDTDIDSCFQVWYVWLSGGGGAHDRQLTSGPLAVAAALHETL